MWYYKYTKIKMKSTGKKRKNKKQRKCFQRISKMSLAKKEKKSCYLEWIQALLYGLQRDVSSMLQSWHNKWIQSTILSKYMKSFGKFFQYD